MTHTKQEIEKMNENITQIRDYLKTLAPKLRDGHTIYFKYDGFHCSIRVCHTNATNAVEGYIGYKPVPWENAGTIDTRPDSEYFEGVIMNWYEIKTKFLQEIERQDNTRNTIFNFEI